MPTSTGSTPLVNPFVDEITRRLAEKTISRIAYDEETALLALGAGESVVIIAPGSAVSQSILSLGKQLCHVTESRRSWRDRLKSWLD
jgi:Flp pilus assembly CpaE family ATPase